MIFTLSFQSKGLGFKASQCNLVRPRNKCLPACPGQLKFLPEPVNSSYWLPAEHSKVEPAGNYHTNGDLG